MRKIVVISSLAASLALIAVVKAQIAGSAPQSRAKAAKIVTGAAGHGSADSITEEELKIYLNFLASDQLEGRNLPSRGYDIAALYIAGHLAEWGLKPGGSSTDTMGPLQPYFMPLELVSRQVVPEDSKASLTAPASAGRGWRGGAGGEGRSSSDMRTTSFEYEKDWTAVQGLCLPFRGFSRSGATISVGMLAGASKSAAETFSFALAVVLTPAVVVREAMRLIRMQPTSGTGSVLSAFAPSLLGAALAFLAGLLALKWLSRWLESGRWYLFGIYCLAAAVVVFALYRFGY